MFRILSVLAFALPISLPAFAFEKLDGYFIALKACEAYQSKNKLTNPGDVETEAMRAYEIKGINKVGGDFFQMRVPGAPVTMDRWVHVDCGLHVVSANTPVDPGPGGPGDINPPPGDESQHHLLALSWQPAFCEGSVSEVYAWAADCCGEAGPRRCPPDHADEMEPSQIAVQVLRGDAAIAAQETLQLAVAAIDRLNVEGIPDPLSGRKVQGFVANAHGRSAGRIAAMTVRNQNDVGIQNRFEHRLQGLGVDRRKNLADGCAAAIGGDQDRHLFIRQAALAGLAATLARLAIQSARSLVALKHVSLVNFDNALEFRPILACGLQETVPPAEGRIDAKSASTGRFPYRLALGQRHAE